MEWYLNVLKNYAQFRGRARRKELWMFFLVNLIISFAIAIVETMLGGPGYLTTIYSLAVFIPTLAVSARRLHDTDRSAWWLLIGLIPLLGFLILLVFYVLEGTAGDNSHGADPKQVA